MLICLIEPLQITEFENIINTRYMTEALMTVQKRNAKPATPSCECGLFYVGAINGEARVLLIKNPDWGTKNEEQSFTRVSLAKFYCDGNE